MRRLLTLVVALAVLPSPASPAPSRSAVAASPARATASLGALDVIALEICYTTIIARYYREVDPAVLLAGARSGVVAYLASRGVSDPKIPLAAARADRYRAESDIDRDVALAVARYGSRVRTGDLVAKAIEGELAALHDPYSVLFRPAAFKSFVGVLDGRPSAGIGAELDVTRDTHAVRIADVFPGSPAEAAGLLPGDVITSIDGAPVPASTDAVGAALRGKPETAVRIAFTRGGAAHDPVSVTRAVFTPPDVTGRTLAGGVGYVRLRSFGAQSPQQLDAALAKLRAANARAYVVDVRANGGGYRDAAVAIASRFVHGTVVTTHERGARPVAFTAKTGVATLDAPFALLVDGDTASAAEILAGAVQDAHTGTLVGTRTFGKGLVQETFPLPDGGAIKLTVARYVTPSGRDIDKVGITPDVIVAEPSDAHPGEPGADPQLDRALEILRSPAITRDAAVFGRVVRT